MLSMEQLIKSYEGQPVTVLLNRGNRGDGVVHMGGRVLLNKYNVDYREIQWLWDSNEGREATGETLFIYGCGNFSRHFNYGVAQLDCFLDKFNKIYILSASFEIACEMVRKMLRRLSEKVVVFCREKYSFDQVRSLVPFKDNIYLDHDLAFKVNYDKWLDNGGKGKLFSFRSTGDKHLRTIIIKNYFRLVNLFSKNVSISDVSSGEIEGAIKMIEILSSYDEIYTDRAHNMIVGAMLGKKVYAYASEYHKLKGIYEYSLAHFPNVVWRG